MALDNPVCYQMFTTRVLPQQERSGFMPIYEYQCKVCGHAVEVLQKLSDAPLTDCPSCHRPELRKKISAAGFRLKGGGWYETDFKTGGKKNLAGDAASSGTTSAASESSTASKSSSSGDGKASAS